MKKVLFPILFCLPVMVFASGPDKKNDCQGDRESTRLSLYIPGFMMKMGSWFVNKEKDPELKTALKKIRSTSIVVREGDAYDDYNASGKYTKKMKSLERRNFDELITAVDDEEKVSIQIHQNKKEKIRQLVVLVDDGTESFVFLRLRCNIHPDDLKKWMNQENDVHEAIRDVVDI